ncbi:MAG: glycosyltransferase family 2 protein [Flavobacteriales bacterium]
MISTVNIVIPCRNEEKYIAKCLESIVCSDFDKSMLTVCVCDGVSTDNTVQIIKYFEIKYPYIHYLQNPFQTTPHALNLGIKHVSADVSIILGAHAEIYPDFIDNCLKAFKHDQSIGCVGGIIENIHEDEESKLIALAMSSSFGVGNAHFRTGTAEGYVDTVAFGAYTKEVFEKCGYFDEDLIRNQDDEFNYRLIKNRFKIWLDKSIRSKYYVRASKMKLKNQYYQYGYWKVFVNKKHRTVTTLRQLIPAIWVAYIVLGLPLSLIVGFMLLPQVLLLYLIGLALYFVIGFMFSSRLTEAFPERMQILKIFSILHLSYGKGYLLGVVHFIVLNKKPVKKSIEITR